MTFPPEFVRSALARLRPLVSPVVDALAKRRLAAAVNIADLRLCAKRRMHEMCFGYLDSGADDEVTLRRNKDAFSSWELHYNVLTATAPETIDLSTKLLGLDVKLPFLCCPCAGQRMFHTEGEIGVANAALAAGAAFSLSTLATTRPSEFGPDFGDHAKIFQLYVWKDRALVRAMLQQAREANFQVLALTVDLTWYGNRERDVRNGFTVPPSHSFQQVWGAVNAPAWTWDYLSTPPYTYALLDHATPAESLTQFTHDQLKADFGWADAAWLVQEWNGPVLLKGVVRPDDAKRAVEEAGFSGVWVSNHGGRQLSPALDGAPAAFDMLPAIRNAVGPDATVVVDGGVQRGTDVLKALACGADAVGIGKPMLYGLGAGGEAGVARALDMLKIELSRGMGLLGCHDVQDLKARGHDLVRKREASLRDAMGARYSKAGII